MNFTIENNILLSTEKFLDTKHNLGQLIYDVLNGSPHHVSQIHAETGKQTTYAEMKNHSVGCALWMKDQGIGPDDIVVVCAEHHTDTYVPVLATFFLDAAFSGWNQNISLHAARRYIKQFAPKVIFTSDKAAAVIQEASKLENSSAKLIVFEKFSNLQTLNDILYDQKKDMIDNFTPVNKKSPGELAAVILSSGSTGLPKGVMVSSKALVALSLQRIFPSKNSLKMIYYSTLAWISGLYFLLHTILLKYTRIIPMECNIDNSFEMIEKYKIDFLAIPPIFVNTLAKSNRSVQKYDLRSLKYIFIGGCKISKQNLENLKEELPNATIRQIFGMTETLRLFQTNDKTQNVESIGFIFTECQAKFVDLTTKQSLGPNQHGEIRVKTPLIMIGYYENIEATRNAFDKEGWFCTGDIGYYDNAGEAFVVGRVKEIIKYKCHQVSPAEIEEVLLSHHEVQEAAVVGVSNEMDGDWPTAFVEKTLESKVTEKELIEYTSSILEDCKRLRGGIHFIDKLPRTGSGKIAKNELRQLAENLMNSKVNL